jgi:hypothetical protein
MAGADGMRHTRAQRLHSCYDINLSSHHREDHCLPLACKVLQFMSRTVLS